MNDAGKATKKIEITVFEPPSFLEFENENITIFANESRQVEIIALGHPYPKVFWTFENATIMHGDTLYLNSSMKNGMYTCIAENIEGQAKSSFHFKVLALPSFLSDFNALDRVKEVRKGEHLELLCPFEDFNEIIWMQNNKTIPSEHNTILKLKKINELSSGDYECVASNTVGSQKFAYQVSLLTPPTIAVNNAKTFEVEFINFDVQEVEMTLGESLALECDSVGNPTPQTHWSKADEELTRDKLLKIEKTTTDDAGTYTCLAENDQGTARKIVKVKVLSKPFLENGINLVTKETFAGAEMTLECKINGSPEPNIIWTKDG